VDLLLSFLRGQTNQLSPPRRRVVAAPEVAVR
jgi:hypothetical protein